LDLDRTQVDRSLMSLRSTHGDVLLWRGELPCVLFYSTPPRSSRSAHRLATARDFFSNLGGTLSPARAAAQVRVWRPRSGSAEITTVWSWSRPPRREDGDVPTPSGRRSPPISPGVGTSPISRLQWAGDESRGTLGTRRPSRQTTS